jgi:hypothetical protein
MTKHVLRFLIATTIAVGGWSLGRIQAGVSDFEVMIDAPVGHVNITCIRGCDWGAKAYGGKTYFLCGGSADGCDMEVNGTGIAVGRVR